MSVLKLSEIRELNESEMTEKLAEFRKTLFEMRMKNRVNQLENPAEMKLVRHAIAQIETVRREKALQTAQKESV